MTQLQQAERRTTVLTSALVAAIIAITITVSGMLIAPSFVQPSSNAGDVTRDERLDRAEAGGLEWQERYEQMYPTR